MADLAKVYEAARNRGAVFDFSSRARWRLSGPDRVRFLNGQVTNDVRRVPPDGLLPACVTTAKGKLSGVILISAWPGALCLDAEPGQREALTARLERYIIADDVLLEDITGQECLFHVRAAGPPAVPEGATLRHATRLGAPGFDIAAPAGEHARILAGLLGQGLVEAGEEVAEAMRIEAGVPRWGAELDEDTLPPEAGLDRVAIDYHKGCYIGQEVISRIKSLGHVNRSLTGFASAAPLAAGMEIRSAEAPGKAVGRITSAAWSFGLARWAALGYLKRGIPTAALYACTPEGATAEIEIRDLPAAS